MFRAEERYELNPGRVKKRFNRRAALGVKPRVIRDESNVLAAQRREFFGFENVDPGLHAPRAPGFFLGGARRNARDADENETQ
jgi:hypothetical protein